MKRNITFNSGNWLALLLVISCSVYLSVQKLHAQVLTTYTFSSSSGTYTPISGGTLLGATGNDDQVYLDPATPGGITTTVPTGPGFSIGFNFELNGVVYDRVALSTNGWLALGQSSLTPSIDMNNSLAADYSYPVMSTGFTSQPDVLKNRILPFNTDLQMPAGASIRIETIGTAPSRTCVIQWSGMQKFTTSSTVDNFNFQARLNETSNTVDFVYGSFTADPPNNPISLGILLNSGFIARASASSWTASSAAVSNTDVMPLTNTILPSSGLTYTWTPVPRTYQSSTVSTANTLPVAPAATNKEVVMLDIVVTGITSTVDLTSLDISTNGTTSLSDITNLNVYYTGSSSTFSPVAPFGSTVVAPAATNTVTGTTSLSSGDNYFWVTYDISSSATLSNFIDAEITSVTVGGTPQTPTVTAPAGNRQILAPVVASIVSLAPQNLSGVQATIGGNITFDGGSNITASGVVFGTSPNPSIGDPGVVDSTTTPLVLLGNYTFDLSGLLPNTFYYYRAYAINSIGTAYGNLDSFNTEPIISALPYSQDFEVIGNNGWKTSIVGGSINDWELGTPAKTQLNSAYSGTNAWVTRLTGTYNDFSNCALTSPQFDFTTYTTDPIINFRQNFVSEQTWDAVVLEISISGGAWTRLDPNPGSGPNFNTPNSTSWYNRSTFNGPLGAPNWADNSNLFSSNVANWIQSSTALTGAAGQSDVRFRFHFQSDGSGTFEGWAIDDIGVQLATAPDVSNGTSSNVTTTHAVIEGKIVSNGFSPITASGIVFSTSPAPVIGDPGVVDSTTNPLVTDGSFAITTDGLTLGTLYYYRAYATNAIGTTYGPDSTFTTLAAAIIPTVNSVPASNLDATVATVGGSIISDGGDPITMSGVVIGTAPNPAIGDPGVIDSVTAGIFSGSFSFNLAGLTSATKYYFRAYAINGPGTAYSNLDSFTTSPIISAFPYNENFDITGPNNGWSTVVTGGVNDWELGTPSKGYLNSAFSAPNAWVTKLSGNYDNGVNAALTSPQFDFTAVAVDPILRFKHKFSAIGGIDGGVVEISINGGAWTQLDNTVGSGSNFTTPSSYDWNNFFSPGFWNPTLGFNFSGISNGYPDNNLGWIESRTILSGAAGQANVKVRMRFATTTFTFFGTNEGWEVDNIEVFEATAPAVTTDFNTNITSTNVRLAGSIVNDGFAPISASGIVVGNTPAPVIGDPGVIDSATSPVAIDPGQFELNIGGLSPATTYYYRTYAINAVGTTYGPDSSFTTNATASVPVMRLGGATNIGYAFADISGSITTDGGDLITASGMVYSTSPNPQLGDPGVVDSTTNPVVVWGTSGKYAFSLRDLTASTKYYFRAYAINSIGTGYSTVDSFTTDPKIMTTGTSMNITTAFATLSGNIRRITSSGDNSTITESGILLSTSPAPVIGGIGVVDSITNPLVNTGTYTINFDGLNLGTTYYYTAYAINSYGTFYGADSSFTTNLTAVIPTVFSSTVQTGFTDVSAIIQGNITSDGGDPVTASGVVYSTTPAPTLGDPGVVDSTTNPVVTSGRFSFTITGLTPNTQYYYRTYAVNSVGTAYSVEDSFTTDFITVSALPYMQDFEGNDNSGWKSSIVGGSFNDWEFGTPAKSQLNAAYSGVNAWVTRLTGTYNNFSNCAITSPTFDFTTATSDPIIRFRQNFVSEAFWDALVLEVSIAGGPWNRVDAVTGSGSNFNTLNSLSWYNRGVGAFNGPMGPPNWADNSNTFSSNVGNWIQSSTTLQGTAGQSDVKVRLRFQSDGSGLFEGWAIDDIEVFTIEPPTVQASAVTVSGLTSTDATVSWTNGNGAGRIVVARPTTATVADPVNRTMYAANAAFGSGSATGTDNFVVYSGTGTSVVVTGLALLTNYTFTVYEFNGSDMFVKFAIPGASNNGTTLPVKLTAFTASKQADDVLISWTTASETNNKGFEVERSVDGRTFGNAGFIKGALNSNRPLNYNFTDTRAFIQTNSNVLYYRLKQVDADGRFAYSNTVRVVNNASRATVSVYPNPFTNTYSVSFDAANAGTVNLKMTDLQGRLVAEQTTTVMKGTNKVTVDSMNNMQTGIYFVKVTVDGQTQVLKLVKN